MKTERSKERYLNLIPRFLKIALYKEKKTVIEFR